MDFSDDGPPLGSPEEATRARYLLDKSTIVDAHRAVNWPRNRLATVGSIIVGVVSGLLILFGFGSAGVGIYLVLALALVVGVRFGVPALVGKRFDAATDEAGQMRVTLTIRPDGLQIEDGFAATVMGWRLFGQSRRTDDYLLLAARGRGAVVVPLAEVSPLFEANLERMLVGAGVHVEPVAPPGSLVFRGLQGVLVVSLLFLVLCVAIVIVAGGPNRDRVGTCPAGQIAIVTQDSGGRITTVCR